MSTQSRKRFIKSTKRWMERERKKKRDEEKTEQEKRSMKL